MKFYKIFEAKHCWHGKASKRIMRGTLGVTPFVRGAGAPPMHPGCQGQRARGELSAAPAAPARTLGHTEKGPRGRFTLTEMPACGPRAWDPALSLLCGLSPPCGGPPKRPESAASAPAESCAGRPPARPLGTVLAHCQDPEKHDRGESLSQPAVLGETALERDGIWRLVSS